MILDFEQKEQQTSKHVLMFIKNLTELLEKVFEGYGGDVSKISFDDMQMLNNHVAKQLVNYSNERISLEIYDGVGIKSAILTTDIAKNTFVIEFKTKDTLTLYKKKGLEDFTYLGYYDSKDFYTDGSKVVMRKNNNPDADEIRYVENCLTYPFNEAHSRGVALKVIQDTTIIGE